MRSTAKHPFFSPLIMLLFMASYMSSTGEGDGPVHLSLLHLLPSQITNKNLGQSSGGPMPVSGRGPHTRRKLCVFM